MKEKIKAARIRAGLTQSQLEKRAGLGNRILEGYEQGRRFPSVKTLKKLAKALKCEVADLI